MSDKLQGKKIAFLVANEGIEQVELTRPWQAVEEAGGEPVLIAPDSGKAQGMDHLDKADTFDVDLTVTVADASDYDGLALPGGVANPDNLRQDEDAVAFARAFFEAGKPVAAGLTTSRNPDDLDAFCVKMVEEFCEGVHDEQREQTVG